MNNKTLQKMEKETEKISKKYNSVSLQKDELVSDIKAKNEYKKKLEQTINTFMSLDTSDTKKMIDNIEKELSKLSGTIDSLSEKRDVLSVQQKALNDKKKKMDSVKDTYKELVEKMTDAENKFFKIVSDDTDKPSEKVKKTENFESKEEKEENFNIDEEADEQNEDSSFGELMQFGQEYQGTEEQNQESHYDSYENNFRHNY